MRGLLAPATSPSRLIWLGWTVVVVALSSVTIRAQTNDTTDFPPITGTDIFNESTTAVVPVTGTDSFNESTTQMVPVSNTAALTDSTTDMTPSSNTAVFSDSTTQMTTSSNTAIFTDSTTDVTPVTDTDMFNDTDSNTTASGCEKDMEPIVLNTKVVYRSADDLVYSCDANYAIDGVTDAKVTCGDGNMWTTPRFTCSAYCQVGEPCDGEEWPQVSSIDCLKNSSIMNVSSFIPTSNLYSPTGGVHPGKCAFQCASRNMPFSGISSGTQCYCFATRPESSSGSSSTGCAACRGFTSFTKPLTCGSDAGAAAKYISIHQISNGPPVGLQITSQAGSFVRNDGESIELMCQSSTEVSQASWYFNGNNITNDDEYIVGDLVSGSITLTFTASNTTGGNYSCLMSNAKYVPSGGYSTLSSSVTATATVIVTDWPAVTSYGCYSFTPTIHNDMQRNFYRGLQTVTPGQCAYACAGNGTAFALISGVACACVSALPGSQFELGPTGTCGELCTGYRNHPVQSYVCGNGSLLAVYGIQNAPPLNAQITAPSRYRLRTGEAFNLTCTIADYSFATSVQWTLDSMAISTPSADVFGNSTSSTLTVTASSMTMGKYTCTFSNDNFTPQGDYVELSNSAVASLTLSVQDPAKIQGISPIAHVNELSSVIFFCNASGSPAPNISWYYNGRILASSTSPSSSITTTVQKQKDSFSDNATSVAASSVVSSMLLLDNVTKQAYEGSYMCVASNELSPPHDNLSVALNVYVPPIELSPLLNVSVPEGDPAMFFCNISGVPAPNITWYKDGKVISESVKVQIVSSNSSLVLRNLTYEDRGNYHCVADNRHSTIAALGGIIDSTAAFLDVYVSPRITTGPDNITVVLGASTTLSCNSYGNPRPSISWVFNGEAVDNSQYTTAKTSSAANSTIPSGCASKLTLSNVTYLHAGVYTCISSVVTAGVQLLLPATAQYSAWLTVHESARILGISPIAHVNELSSVIFFCNASGSPAPNISWYYNGRILDSSTSPSASITTTVQKQKDSFSDNATSVAASSVVSSMLLLGNVTKQAYEGSYMCVASNELSPPHDNLSVALNVYVPTIELSPLLNVSVPEGDPAMFFCNISGVPAPNITWYKDGKVISESVKVQIVSSNSSLVLRNLTYEDHGNYHCVADNRHSTIAALGGIIDSTAAFLDVYVSPRITTGPDNITVVLGASTTLSCNSYGNPRPSISWVFNGEAVDNSQYTTATTSSTANSTIPSGCESNLTLSNVTYLHAGVYTCVSSIVTAGVQLLLPATAQYSAWLTVHESARILGISPIAHVNELSSVIFFCNASGSPAPNISWYYNGRILDSSTSPSSSITTTVQKQKDSFSDNATSVAASSVVSSMFLLGNVTKQAYEGSYMCVASNELSPPHDNLSVALNVYVPPIELSPLLNVSVPEGDPAMFFCNISGVPAPNITWYKDGKVISESVKVQIVSSNSSLVLRNLTYEDRGNYHCVADNRHSTIAALGGIIDSTAAFLDVYVSPRITTGPDNITVVLGASTTLSCNSYGNPRPSISWVFNGEAVDNSQYTTAKTSSTANSTIPSGCESNLTLSNVTYLHAGVYTCVSSIVTAGVQLLLPATAQYSAWLTVHESARILGISPIAHVNELSSVIFFCNASGSPAPNISWYYNGRILDSSTSPSSSITKTVQKQKDSFSDNATSVAASSVVSSMLLLGNVTKQAYEGSYMCVASNELSPPHDNLSVALNIYVPPIELSPLLNVSVSERDSAMFFCNISGFPLANITWYKDGEVISESVKVQIVSSNSSLVLRNLTYEDRGNYHCVADNRHSTIAALGGIIDSAAAFLDVYVSPRIITGPSNATLPDGSSIAFTCKSYGNPVPNISWVFNGENLDTSSYSTVKVSYLNSTLPPVYESNLTLSNVTYFNSGVYTCISSIVTPGAHLLIPTTANYSAWLTVQVGLYMESAGFAYLNVFEHSPFILNCTTRANPAPSYHWRVIPAFQGEIVANVSSSFINPSYVSQYTVSNATVQGNDHIHNITCTASNVGSSQQSTTQVTVNVIPQFLSSSSGVFVTCNENEKNVYLSCTFRGIEEPAITWQELTGSAVSGGAWNETTSTATPHVYSGTLKFPRVRKEDEGNYTCIGRNGNGTDAHHLFLRVQVRPRIVPEKSVQDGIENLPLSLVIVVTRIGQPAVPVTAHNITWSKVDNPSWNASTQPRLALSSDRLNLTFSRIHYSDAGEYEACLINAAGSACSNFTILYAEPAKIIGGLTPAHVNELSSVSFFCNVSGSPAPNISWYYNGTTLDDSWSTVHISSSAFSNAATIQRDIQGAASVLQLSNVTNHANQGSYSCLASNGYSPADNYTAALKVYVPTVQLSPLANASSSERGAATFLCSVYGVPPPTISWFKDGKALFPSENVQMTRGNAILALKNVTFGNRGDYHCVADNRHSTIAALGGIIDSKAAALDVYVLPVIRLDPKGVEALRGDMVQLPVTLSHPGHPQVPSSNITWTKIGDLSWSGFSSGYSLSTDNLTLSIANMQHYNAGTYHVRLGNLAGEVNVTFMLTYAERPAILTTPTSVRTNENSLVVLECIGTGLPKPTIHWYHNASKAQGVLEASADHPDVHTNKRGGFAVKSTLTILSVKNAKNQGNFECVVDNGHSPNATASAKISVYVPAVIEIDTHDTAVLAGNTVIFMCNTSGIPAPTVTWFRNGVLLQQDDLVGRVSFFRGQNVLTIYRTEIADADLYHCEASNKDRYAGGVVTGNPAQLDINYAPNISPAIPRKLLSFEGSSLTVPCTYSGQPTPNVHWCRVDDTGNCLSPARTDNCARLLATQDGPLTNSMTISPLKSCHGGSYLCTVSNEVAVAKQQLQLTVQGKTSIGILGNFSMPTGYSAKTEKEQEDFFVQQVTEHLFQGRLVGVEHFQSRRQGPIFEIQCDVTAPADYIAQISGNSSASNIGMHFSQLLQNSVFDLKLAPQSDLTVFAYDVCSPDSTDGGQRGMFSWPETFHDEEATLLCPVELADSIFRYATRSCISGRRLHELQLEMAYWATPNMSACPTPATAKLQQLSKIEFNASEPGSVLASSQFMANLTENSAELTSDAVDFASTAIFNLVAAISGDEVFNQSIGQQVANSSLQTVDNILSVTTKESLVGSAPAKRIAKSMERLVTSLDVSTEEPFVSQKENIGFAVSCPKENATTQAFRSAGEGGQFFVGETNGSAAGTDAGVAFDIAGSTISAITDSSVLSNDSLCNLASTQYILYKTQALFQDSSLGGNSSVGSQIISAQVGNRRHDHLDTPATMSFEFVDGTFVALEDPVECVFWDFDKYDGKGGWSSENCNTTRSDSFPNRTVCQCSHLTNFAVLFSRHVPTEPSHAETALKYISMIGCGISMLALLATLFVIMAVPKLRRSHHHQMIFGLSITLLLFLAVLTVVLYYENAATSDVACKALAIALHYLLLCSFMWMSVDATFLYKRVTVVFDGTGQRLKILLQTLIFVIPLVIVGATAGASTADAYKDGKLCWIKDDLAFYCGLVAPVGVSLLYNLGVLLAVAASVRASRKKITTYNTKKERSRDVTVLGIVVSLSMLFGLTWSFGFLVLIRDQIVFQYIFTVLNSLQGLAILIHTVRGSEAKKGLSDMVSTSKRATSTTTAPSSKQSRTALDAASPRGKHSLGASTLLESPTTSSADPGSHVDQARSQRSAIPHYITRKSEPAPKELKLVDLDTLEPYQSESEPIGMETSVTPELIPLEGLHETHTLSTSDFSHFPVRQGSVLKFNFLKYDNAEAGLLSHETEEAC
ncbi:hemicentin-1-like [Sycon ciliatum]|uniref:hemicentin-1-like n=1 Tax=Sycon ciliatum TaxID=27933 RepID=UPI0031F5F995